MKTIIKNSGLVLLFAGLIIVAYTSFSTIQENTGLWVGGLMIFLGLIAYIVTNRFVE